jgi:hypothetical protein
MQQKLGKLNVTPANCDMQGCISILQDQSESDMDKKILNQDRSHGQAFLTCRSIVLIPLLCPTA